ncbi:MAG: hypothetical protein HS115_15850 [Spirochaetales bacterium]|nr:hypothetical protein [Spirochaetales bacterium]
MKHLSVTISIFLLVACSGSQRREKGAGTVDRPTVVLWPFENRGPVEMNSFGAGWLELTEALLYSQPELDPLPHRTLASMILEIAGNKPSESTLLALARTMGADFLLKGSYHLNTTRLVIRSELFDLRGRTSVQKESHTVDPEQVHTVPDLLMNDLALELELTPKKDLLQIDLKTFHDLSDALMLSRNNKGAAYELLRKEKVDVLLPQARDLALALYFELFPASGTYKLAEQWKGDGFRLQRQDLARQGDLLEHFGRQRLLELKYNDAEAYLTFAEEVIRTTGLQTSLLNVRVLETRGSLAYRRQNRMLAFSYFKQAEEILERLGREKTLFHIKNLIGAGSVYAAGEQYDLSQKYFVEARSQLTAMNLKESALYATVLYNLGNLRLFQGDVDGALQFYDESRDVLLFLGLANSRLFLMTTANMGAAFFTASDYENALSYLDRAAAAAPALGFRKESLYRDIRYNLVLAAHTYADAMAAKVLTLDELPESEAEKERSKFKLATIKKLLPDFMLSDPLNLPLMQLADCALPVEMPVKNDIFRTGEEYRTVRSYTGQYSLVEQKQEVKTRTFDGRLDDTNVMLRDLFNPEITHRELRFLRSVLLPGKQQPDGSGTVFIDIGPAVAHARFPAITSRNVARDFPGMKVVALDLPGQMRIYRRHIPVYLKRQIQNHKNLYFLQGDGIKSLLEQMQVAENWIFEDRERFEITTETVIIRAANSIDIYVHWSEVEPALRQMAQDFEKNPVLLFFNRGILVKPAGSLRFDVVGYISIRGFHHYMNILDREGEEPYRLFNLVDD